MRMGESRRVRGGGRARRAGRGGAQRKWLSMLGEERRAGQFCARRRGGGVEGERVDAAKRSKGVRTRRNAKNAKTAKA